MIISSMLPSYVSSVFSSSSGGREDSIGVVGKVVVGFFSYGFGLPLGSMLAAVFYEHGIKRSFSKKSICLSLVGTACSSAICIGIYRGIASFSKVEEICTPAFIGGVFLGAAIASCGLYQEERRRRIEQRTEEELRIISA